MKIKYLCSYCHREIEKEIDLEGMKDFEAIRKIKDVSKLVSESCLCRLKDYMKNVVLVQFHDYSYGLAQFKISYDDGSYDIKVCPNVMYDLRRASGVKRGLGHKKVNSYLKTQEGSIFLLNAIEKHEHEQKIKKLREMIRTTMGEDIELMKKVLKSTLELKKESK